ncbi:hypothetical protein RB593_008457 [Gaeumannomyces tritici]
MAPKRKRHGADRQSIDNPASRPSPHRPEQTSLGRHDVAYPDGGGRGGRTRATRRNDRRDSLQNGQYPSSTAPSPSPLSPTAPRPPSASSQSALQPMNAPSLLTPVATPPAPAFPHYDYSIVTESQLSSWTKGGRQHVIDHGVQAANDEDDTEVSALYQELLHLVIDSRLTPQDAGGIVREMVKTAQSENEPDYSVFDPRIIFLDNLTVLVDSEGVKFPDQLREFLTATDISPTLMRELLDQSLLIELGLLRDNFVKRGNQHATNTVYRQAAHNLLREETEGFSKLTAELYLSLKYEDVDLSWEAAHQTFEKVKRLIGTFDLAVARVLDITLDVFAATIVKQMRPFLRFLRVSAWWPEGLVKGQAPGPFSGLPRWARPELYEDDDMTDAEREENFNKLKLERDIAFWDRAREAHLDAFFELGSLGVAESDLERLTSDDSKAGYTAAEREWIKVTKTLPVRGSRAAASILGFKLKFYETPEGKLEKGGMPANLIWMAALLIKIGFITLADIYPHLHHSDEEMETVVREQMTKELEAMKEKERPGATANALMMAGALPDDSPPTMTGTVTRRDNPIAKPDAGRGAKDATTKSDSSGDGYYDPKSALLEHLLVAGAIPEALFMLGRFPWLTELWGHKIFPLIHRILRHSIHKVYEECAPKPVSSDITRGCPAKKVVDPDQTGVRKGSVKLSDQPQPKFLRWPHADKWDTSLSNYRYYFSEWTDNVPVCQSIDDVFTLCSTLLNISGVNIGLDEHLYAGLTRIGKWSLQNDKSAANFDRWQELLKRILIPALSLTKENASLVDSAWSMLRQYPTAVRYNIYSEWFEGQTSRLPAMAEAFKVTRLQTLSTLKRLAATNIPTMAKALAKAAYSSPGIVFKVSLDQIEAYTNLIDAFIECAKYFTDLGYDVLLWSLLSSLGRSRSRTGASVLVTSRWLQALSKFSGHVFKRYSNLDPTPVLLYVNDQLFRGNSTDLVILKEFITSMGGVVSDVDFTDAQLTAMTGGAVLRKQTLINVKDKRYEPGTQKSAQRLMRAMVSSNLAGRLLINIAQYRQTAIYNIPEDEAHIKYLASLVDGSQQILSQYLDLLRSNLDPERFDSLVPDLVSLITEYGLDVSLAFMIGRGSLTFLTSPPSQSSSKDEPIQPQALPAPTPAAAADADGDVSMSAPDEAPKDGETGDKSLAKTTPETQEAPATVARKSDPIYALIQPLVEAVQPLRPATVWQSISPEFFVLFWSLQLTTIAFPQPSYSVENSRLIKQAEEVMRNRSDMTRAGMQKKTDHKNGLLDTAKLIRDEMMADGERMSKLRLRLTRRSSTWFPATAKDAAVADVLLEQCLLPRLLLSATDATYAFRFAKFLHETGVQHFKLMSLYDRLFSANRLRTMIFTCTQREAEHLGRFIKYILTDLSNWHSDKAVYEKEALGRQRDGGKRVYLGFVTSVDADGTPQTFVEHGPFRDLLYGWHKNLNTALKSCLQGMDWMHIRNAITVLQSALDVFPAVDFMGKQFVQQLKTISDRETASKSDDGHRGDLATTAQSVSSLLQKKKAKWVMVQAFRPNTTGEPQEESKPTADTSAKTLRPTAPDFKPRGPTTNLTTDRRPPSVARAEDANTPAQSATLTPSSQDKRLAPATNRIPSVVDKEPSRREGQGVVQNAPGSKASTPQLANSTPARPETPKPSTLPSGNIPGLPKRPDVPVPGQGLGGRTHDRRESASRDSRDTRDSRGPREPRDHREPRESRDTREARDQREARDPRDPRDHRMVEGSRPERLSRDSTGTDRRAPGPDSNGNNTGAPKESSSRPTDKDRNPRSEALPNRSSRDSARDPPREPAPRDALKELPRDRSLRGRESSRGSPRDSHRDGPGAPPSAAPPPAASVQEPTINPERARLLAREQPEIFQPERPGTARDRRSSPGPSPRDDARGRNPSSRNQSPRSGERFHIESVMSEREREGMHGRTLHPSHAGPPGRDGYGEHASHMQSRDRHRDREADRPRDNTAGPAPSSRQSFDQDNGRLSYQDPNYGRLNHIPSVASEIPSGPRARGGGGREPAPRHSSLNLPGPSPRHDGRFPPNGDIPRPPSPDRHPPTGPSSGRPPARRGRGQYENPANVPLPSSPAGAAPPPQSTGVHPDRMRLVSGPSTLGSGPGPNGPGPGPAGGSMSANSIPINPDRMNQINASSLPPQPPRRSMGPPQQTPDRPPQPHGPPGSGSNQRVSSSGGPNHQSGSATDGRGGYPAPSGPSSSHERTDRSDRARGRGRTMLDGINTTLEKAGQESRLGDAGRTSHRGRAHGTMAGSDAQVLTGGSPATTPIQDRMDPMRRDLPGPRGPLGHHADLNNGSLPPPNREPRSGAGDGQHTPSGSRDGRDGKDHDRSSRREHRDRSGRPSRRSSRERSTDREREPREHREPRDRRSGAPSGGGSGSHVREGGDREGSSSRRSGRESAGGGGRKPLTPLGGGGRDLASGGRESRHRGESRSDNGGSNNGSGEWGGNSSSGGRGGRSGGSGGGPPRSGDDRREGGGGGREDRGSRKRRSDDAAGLAPTDRDKRQRR